MAFLDDMGETARKIFLVGVGAVAATAEKSTQVVDDLVKKGELTVEQGKTLNEELKRKATNAGNDTEASILRARLRTMTAEQREAYVKKVEQIKDDLNAEPVEVDVEVEEPEEPAADADAPTDAPADDAE